ncbi:MULTISPECIES: hypothetical protein [Brucella]|uniref:hypothetical protein n=1 Tax=Brucella TaxID=234 RepID=UPI00046D9693|nr:MULTISPECIES: hypothetical protein [Brucella]
MKIKLKTSIFYSKTRRNSGGLMRKFIALALVAIAAAPLISAMFSDMSNDVRTVNKLKQSKTLSEKAIIEERDKMYKNVCKIYFSQSYFGKMTTGRNQSWCEEYKDRM